MKRLMMMVAAMWAAMLVAATDVPSDADVRAVGKYVEELTKGDLAQMRQKKITKEQYADALLGYAADEKKPAAKFALFREAFKVYAEAKSWEKAVGAYGAAQAEGGTEYALAAVGRTTIPGAAKELKVRIEADRKSYKQIGILKIRLKKTPDDESLCESLGLEYAAVGNWNGALAAFLTAPGEVAKVADWELNKGSAYTAAKAAKFWWDYAEDKPKAKMEAVRLHAAMWYEIALGENAYSGNEAKIVQGRIDETKSYNGAAMQDKATLSKQVKELKPIVLPVKGKIVIEFLGVPAGEFMMGTEDERYRTGVPSVTKPHKVIITRPFWLSKYKVTKEQWDSYQKISLTEMDKSLGGMKIAHGTSYNDAMAFCERLTKQFKNKLPHDYVVRLPTEAEWEYAFALKDSDNKSPYRDWEANLKDIAVLEIDVRRRANANKYEFTNWEAQKPIAIEVGTKKPNGLGLYDMIGNGLTFTLDTIDGFSMGNSAHFYHGDNVNQRVIIYKDKEIDPLRFFSMAGAVCIMRGTKWDRWAPALYGKRGHNLNEEKDGTIRLCIGPNLMKEKGYSFKPGKKK